MGKRRKQRKNISDIKKPCSPPRSQGSVNTGVLTPKIMKQTDDQVNSYDAGDMMDAHALAKCQLGWLASLISTIKHNFDSGRNFHNAELIEIAQYLADSFTEDHRNKTVQYESDWKAQNAA